jgi:hypothetical protein
MTSGRCMHCKKNVTIVDPKSKETKRGATMVMGTCPTCHGKVSTFVSKKGGCYEGSAQKIKTKTKAKAKSDSKPKKSKPKAQ